MFNRTHDKINEPRIITNVVLLKTIRCNKTTKGKFTNDKSVCKDMQMPKMFQNSTNLEC